MRDYDVTWFAVGKGEQLDGWLSRGDIDGAIDTARLRPFQTRSPRRAASRKPSTPSSPRTRRLLPSSTVTASSGWSRPTRSAGRSCSDPRPDRRPALLPLGLGGRPRRRHLGGDGRASLCSPAWPSASVSSSASRCPPSAAVAQDVSADHLDHRASSTRSPAWRSLPSWSRSPALHHHGLRSASCPTRC